MRFAAEAPLHTTQHSALSARGGEGQLRPHLLSEASNLKVHICTETKQLYNLLQHSEALYGRGHHRWHGERRGKWDRPVVGRAASTASSSRPKPPKPAANWQGGHHLQQQISATSQFDGQLTCPMAGNRPPKTPDRHSSFVAILFELTNFLSKIR